MTSDSKGFKANIELREIDMTKEQTIKHLKLMQSGARKAIRFTKNDKEISEEERKEDIEIYQDQLEVLDLAIKAMDKLEQIEQIAARWNNDASHSFEDMCKINAILKE